MSYTVVQYAYSGLNLSSESLSQAEAHSKVAQLVQEGYQGWAQWTGKVVRLETGTVLPESQGTLLAAECFKGDISYKLNYQNKAWLLTKMHKVAGQEYLVQERSFVKIEPPLQNSSSPAPAHHDGSVKYEIFWPAQVEVSTSSLTQTTAFCARLTQF